MHIIVTAHKSKGLTLQMTNVDTRSYQKYYTDAKECARDVNFALKRGVFRSWVQSEASSHQAKWLKPDTPNTQLIYLNGPLVLLPSDWPDVHIFLANLKG
jgi:hypothetical protein